MIKTEAVMKSKLLLSLVILVALINAEEVKTERYDIPFKGETELSVEVDFGLGEINTRGGESQDYILRFAEDLWPQLAADLESFEFERLDSDRSGQLQLRFKLPDARAVYPLLDVFRRHDVELADFRQELPTLEDIFLSVISDGTQPGGEQ